MIKDDHFIKSFIEILDDPDLVEVNIDTKFKHLDEWDSLTNLSLLVMVDAEFNVKLNAEDVRNSNTIKDLIDLINSKLSA